MLQQTRCVNQIDDVCKEIERTINRAIQNTINTLEKDANTLEEQTNLRLKLDDESRNYNFKASSRGKHYCTNRIASSCSSFYPIPSASQRWIVGSFCPPSSKQNSKLYVKHVPKCVCVCVCYQQQLVCSMKSRANICLLYTSRCV